MDITSAVFYLEKVNLPHSLQGTCFGEFGTLQLYNNHGYTLLWYDHHLILESCEIQL